MRIGIGNGRDALHRAATTPQDETKGRIPKFPAMKTPFRLLSLSLVCLSLALNPVLSGQPGLQTEDLQHTKLDLCGHL